MFCFLETDIGEQKKYENRIHTSVDKTVNNIRYEIKFENRVKDKNNFFIKWNIAFVFFFFKQKYISEADTKKHRYVSAKAANSALVKLTDWITKNDHMIHCALFFCKW